jgi:Ca-activated chloride channel homolog
MRSVAVAGILTAAALGATLLGAGAWDQQARYTARVEAVRVPVMVSHHGKPVTGLVAADFELLDNGVPQAVEAVDSLNLGLDVLFALDASSSVVRNAMDAKLKSAALSALEVLRPVDRAGVVHFSHRVSLASGVTSDLAAVGARLYASPPDGATALFDAIVGTLVATEPDPGRRRLLIVYTDGIDTISWHSPADVIALAGRSDFVVYGVVTKSNRQLRETVRLDAYDTMLRFLSDLTGMTGGRLVDVDRDHLSESFREVVQRFSQGYQLVFYPRGVEKAGWHTLKVRVRQRRGDVQARRGYYAD